MSSCSDISDYMTALDGQIARCYGALWEIAAEGMAQLDAAEAVAEAGCAALGFSYIVCQAVGEAARELGRQFQDDLKKRAQDAADGATAAEDAKAELEGLLSHCEALGSGPQNDAERDRIVQEAYGIVGDGLEAACGGDDWNDESDEVEAELAEIIDMIEDLDPSDFG
jgi:hypothetical protein